jgi:uncharacterized protein (DUF983 family)
MIRQGGESPPSAIASGLKGCCPRCGRGALFKGFLTLAPKCDTCGLDYAFADSADGPAVFVCLIGGFIVLGAALWTELVYEPLMWVHLAVFLPLTLIDCAALLRPAKGILVGQQYHTKAEEGRLER